jgi:hypothetical protein
MAGIFLKAKGKPTDAAGETRGRRDAETRRRGDTAK